ncbi:MAG: hypothetical protein FWD71_22630, partial [Oscillospiraceae bacterium]|nr:hypothetical protein [Oscillospiraceae bacterium]
MKKQLLRKIPIQSADETIILSARQLQESNIEYIISGQIEKVSDENILLLTFFNKDNILKDSVTPEFRVFFAEYDYIAQKLDCEPMKWLTGSLDYILPYYSDGSYNGCWTQRSFVADDETLSSIEQFIGIGSEKPLAA